MLCVYSVIDGIKSTVRTVSERFQRTICVSWHTHARRSSRLPRSAVAAMTANIAYPVTHSLPDAYRTPSRQLRPETADSSAAHRRSSCALPHASITQISEWESHTFSVMRNIGAHSSLRSHHEAFVPNSMLTHAITRESDAFAMAGGVAHTKAACTKCKSGRSHALPMAKVAAAVLPASRDRTSARRFRAVACAHARTGCEQSGAACALKRLRRPLTCAERRRAPGGMEA